MFNKFISLERKVTRKKQLVNLDMVQRIVETDGGTFIMFSSTDWIEVSESIEMIEQLIAQNEGANLQILNMSIKEGIDRLVFVSSVKSN